MIKDLNSRFAIAGALRIEGGKGAFTKVIMSSDGGACAEVYLHGAHVARWKDSSGRDGLFLSERAVFHEDKPIRGGIPVVFPQFGPGLLPMHGLVRTEDWEILETKRTESGGMIVVFSISDSPSLRQLWPYRFRCDYIVRLEDGSLDTELRVLNIGDRVLSCTCALHTYLSVTDVSRVSGLGLAGLQYIDILD
ncbi:MAG: D-hexose-6-phosphate mutarotase, partial [Planctomycetes bacterium]|nr:D-hexose-6-phosphate mutarotase [Planctomycetota bacterium]